MCKNAFLDFHLHFRERERDQPKYGGNKGEVEIVNYCCMILIRMYVRISKLVVT